MKTIFKVMFLLCTIGLVPSVAKAQEKVIIDDEASNGERSGCSLLYHPLHPQS